MNIKFKDKIIGKIINDTYYTYRKPIHFMRKYGGFGISEQVIEGLLQNNVKEVIIIYQGKRTIRYRCSLAKFLVSDKTHLFEEDDNQVFVSVKDLEEMK